MNINVGQIIYLLSSREIRVYPAQVIEEIKRKTLSGSETSYVIKLPDKNMSEVHISKIDAEIFTSAEDLEENMIENAKSKIRSLIKNAKSLESVFDNVSVNINSNDMLIGQDENVDVSKPKKRRRRSTPKKKAEEKVTIDLGNGMKGKIDIDSVDIVGGISK